MRLQRVWFFLRVLVLLLLLGCTNSKDCVRAHFEKAGGENSPKLKLEVVSNSGSRSLGLMYRKELGENEGMLFVFPDEKPRTFWMKNTYLELDIFYIDSAFHLVSIQKHAVPLTTTPRPSTGPAQYVVELLGGSADKLGIKPGSKLLVEDELPIPE